MLIEIINNDTDEQIEREKRTKYDKKHEIDERIDVLLASGLLIRLEANVRGVGHDLDPALERGDLKKSQIGVHNVVEVDARVGPRVVGAHALVHVGDEFVGEWFAAVAIDAFVEATGEQLHAHDAEYEPEDETHEQDVEYGRYGTDESIHDHLYRQTKMLALFIVMSISAEISIFPFKIK